MKQYTLFNFEEDEEEDEEVELPPLVFQEEISVRDIKINKLIKKRLLEKFTYFFPNQVEFVSSFFQVPIDFNVVESDLSMTSVDENNVILKKFENYLVTTETSSGKTIMAILYIAKFIEECSEGTAVYSVPMKALGSEKFKEFSELFEGVYDVRLIMGNEERYSGSKSKKTILITTNEKFDQLLRSKENTKNIICVVFDELHLINTDRGPTIEWCVSKIKALKIPRMGLSATIQNDTDVAKWLDAGLINTSFRPIPIKVGFISDRIIFADRFGDVDSVEEIPRKYASLSKKHVENVLVQLIDRKDSVLYFRQSRRGVASTAQKVAKIIEKRIKVPLDLSLPEIKGGEKGDDAILNYCIKWGIAFHHAGLSSKNKSFIEDHFRMRKIHAIVASPTLAIGVNVPAKWVIMDYKAYRGGKYDDVPVSEVKQMMGRAARPQYDREGFAFIYDDKLTFDKQVHLYDKYFGGKCEPITSKYSGFDDMLMSLLGFLSGDIANTVPKILSLYKNTLIHHQSKEFRKSIKADVNGALQYLSTVNPPLIEKNGNKWILSDFGRTISKLYIHPSIALNMSDFITDDYDKSDFSIVYFLFSDGGLFPLRSKQSDQPMINQTMKSIEEFGIELFGGGYIDQNALKTASCLIGSDFHDFLTWAEDDTEEDEFMSTYDVSSGDINRTVKSGGNLQWILKSFRDVASYHNRQDIVQKIRDLNIRLKYGVSDTLVPLCKIKWVGKKYAKKLYEKGYRTRSDFGLDDIENIARIAVSGKEIGENMAKRIVQNAIR